MLTGVAHTAICVPDVEEATRWYRDVLGLTVLSPPYRMAGSAIQRDMGELVPGDVVVKASTVGLAEDDRVLELIEYPNREHTSAVSGGPDVTRPGITHIGLTCDDIATTREHLEGRGVTFLTAGIADIAGLRSTWFVDPWGVVFILIEKNVQARPYWRQPRHSRQ